MGCFIFNSECSSFLLLENKTTMHKMYTIRNTKRLGHITIQTSLRCKETNWFLISTPFILTHLRHLNFINMFVCSCSLCNFYFFSPGPMPLTRFGCVCCCFLLSFLSFKTFTECQLSICFNIIKRFLVATIFQPIYTINQAY